MAASAAAGDCIPARGGMCCAYREPDSQSLNPVMVVYENRGQELEKKSLSSELLLYLGHSIDAQLRVQ